MASKPIIFVDFDGTICFDKYWRSLPVAQYEIIQGFLFGKDRTLLNDWMVGKHTAEEINQMIAEKIGMPYERLWGLFVSDCMNMRASVDTLNAISSLRRKYVVILVTGNMDSFTRFTVPALNLDKYFDHINNSFFSGKQKGELEGTLFMEYAKSFNVPIRDCFLIDNSPSACAAFSRLGGTPYLITPEHDIIFILQENFSS